MKEKYDVLWRSYNEELTCLGGEGRVMKIEEGGVDACWGRELGKYKEDNARQREKHM